MCVHCTLSLSLSRVSHHGTSIPRSPVRPVHLSSLRLPSCSARYASLIAERRMEAEESNRELLVFKLGVLQRKEDELASLIQSIDATFTDMGFRIDNSVSVIKKKGNPSSGIRMKGKLSFRGKEKAEEYFDVMDIDRDGLLNFEDFRAIRAFSDPYSFVDAPEMQTSESWQLFMADSGIGATSNGGISKEQYRIYREHLEQEQPLSDELVYLKLGFLPPKQKQWAFAKFLLTEQMDFRESRLPPSFETGPRDEVFLPEDLSYLLANARTGLSASKPEIALLMYDRALKRKLLNQLQLKYAKINLAKPDYGFSLDKAGRLSLAMKHDELRITSDDIVSVEKKDLLPWMVGCPTLFDTTEVYRILIGFKYQLIRGFRHFESLTRHMFLFAAHINDRLVFRDFPVINRVPKAEQEVSNLKFSVMVGDEDRRDGGLSGSFKLIKLDNTQAVFKQLHLSPDSGSALIIDLLFHSDTDEEDGMKCVQCLRQYLGHHFEKELRGNKLFSGMVVTNALNESDDAKVLRVIFSYKRLVSFDGWLEHMLIPYRLTDFVSVLVGDFRSNLDLASLINNKTTNLSESFAASFDCTLGMRRGLVIRILERLLIVLSAGVTKDQVAVLNEKAQGKGPANHKDAEESRRRVERWHQLHHFFPPIRWGVGYLLDTLKCMQTASLKLHYGSLGEFTHKLGLMDVTFGRTYSNTWMYVPGFVRDTYKYFAAKYKSEMGKKHASLKHHLEVKKKEDDERRIREIMDNKGEEDGPQEQDDRANTIEKLKRLGIDDGNIFQDEGTDPKQHIRQVTDETSKLDVMGFITVENLRRHVLGVHSIELVTGKSKLSLSVQGLDLFDLLPELPNMQSIAEANALKPQKTG